MAKMTDVFNCVNDYTKYLRYGDPVKIYPCFKIIADSPWEDEQLEYWNEVCFWLDKYMRLYNAKVDNQFYDLDVVRRLTPDLIKHYMTLSGNYSDIENCKTTDLYYPADQWGFEIIDFIGSERIFMFSKKSKMADMKYSRVLVPIIIAGYHPPCLNAVMTHSKSIIVWTENLGTELRKSDNCAKLLTHEMMHVFGAVHGSSTSEYQTVLGNITVDPYRITEENKRQVEAMGLKVTNEVKML